MSKKLLMNNVFSNNEGIVKDNLILYLDAMNNTRDGQSSSITSWHDLSGNNYDLQGNFIFFNNNWFFSVYYIRKHYRRNK